ncbi:MAG: ABC transporter substrate-binding protein [Thermomicrobiales bacterium]|nr:ABC transporter substrate-binding protein [Thermomicrobiales bacterium]
MKSYWGKNFSRRSVLQRGGQIAAAAGIAGLSSQVSRFTPEARAEILAKAKAYQDRPVTITAIQPVSPTATSDDYGIAFQEVYNRFMDAYPEIGVEFAYSPWEEYTQALSVAIGGGNAPDVATWIDDQRIPSLAANGFLRSVDDLAAADGMDLGEIDPIALSSNTFAGLAYGLPYYWDDRIFYHNTDHFAEAGITAPPTTWEEAVAMGEELDVKDGDTYSRIGYIPLSPSGGPGAGGNSYLFLYGWQNGGSFVSDDLTTVTVNDPAIVEALAWCVEVSDMYGGAEEQANFIANAARGTNPFLTGSVSMMTQPTGFGVGSVNGSESPVNWAVSASPYNTTPATWSGVLSAALPVGSAHPEESWELAKFMASPEIQTYFAETLSWIPTRRALWDAIPAFATDPELIVGLEEFSNTNIRPPLPNSQELWDEILRASDAALYHQASPQEALDRANEIIQAGLDEYLKNS